MSAIKLPVTVEPFGLEFAVLDADRTNVTMCLKRDRAEQIAIALNVRDEWRREILAVLHDSEKYPQLKLPEQTRERLESLLGPSPDPQAYDYHLD